MEDISTEKRIGLNSKCILKYITLIITGLQLLFFFFPWFTFDPNIMSPYRERRLLVYLIAPFMFIFIYYMLNLEGTWSKVLMEISLLSIVTVLIHAFLTWEISLNISSSFKLADSIVAAQPAFWCTCLLSILSIILFQPQLALRK